MKRNASFFSLVVGLFILALFTNLSAENPIPQGLSNLLSGKTTDTHGVLSGLDDAQIPEVMTLCDVLKHKALHKEIKLSPEAIDLFKATLETRLKSSEWVSLTKTAKHIHHIRAREITMEGHKLTIPEHFLAPVRFVVSDFSPQGEAGTLLPDIRVLFIGGRLPVTARILLDGKEIPVQSMKGGFLSRPALHPTSALSMGSHRVEAILTDASKEVASASWSFTVGEKPVSSPIIPGDAAMIGSFSVPVSTLVPGSSLAGLVEVVVFEGPDGKRLLEYRLSDGSDQETFGVKTTSLFFLNRIIRNPKRREVLRILPKSGAVFTGKETLFSSVYSGEGTVTKYSWLVQEPLGSASGTFETPTISWEVKKWSHVTLKVVVEFLVDDTVSQATFEQHKDVTALEVSTSIGSSRFASYETSASGTVAVSGERLIRDLYSQKSHVLREGETFPFPSGSPGKVSVTCSRWKLAGGTAEAQFVDATASATNLLFSSFGFVEFVHDVAVGYEWENEHHEMEFSPKESFLYGRFFYKASSEFTQFPPGIIFGTDRYLSFKTIHLEINGEKRLITNQPAGYCPVEPPIRLAWSDLFPHAKPIVVNAMLPIAIRKTPTSYAYLPNPSNFRILLKYDKPELAINEEIPCCVYFVTGNVGKSDRLKNRDEWSNFFGYARPLTDWLSVKTYPSPADLVQVEIDPEAPEVYEGQDFKISAKITPKEGLGTGEFTETTQTLDLLDGYQAQTLTTLDWKALLLPPQTPLKQGQNWEFAFQPKEGTGTYEVIASTVVEVKEKDTKTSAKVAGIGSTTAVVKAGLRILSPIDGFSYPLGYPIKVLTSLDENPDDWGKIQWFLDDQPWSPAPTQPKPNLVLDKPGNHKLKAVYKPSVPALNRASGPPVELSHEVSFSVKAVKVSIDPARKVMPYSKDLSISLHARVEFEGHPAIEDSEKPLDLGGQVTAKVTKVEWQAITDPPGGISLKIEKNQLTPQLEFNSACAVTALATVTVVVSKPLNTQAIEETYVLPLSRADLWAIPKPSWLSLDGRFPNKAIVGTKRTFQLKSGNFSFGDGPTRHWDVQAGITPPIQISPALPGVPSQEIKKISFLWSSPKQSNNRGFDFTPFFPKLGNIEISLFSFLDFEPDVLIEFPAKKFEVMVEPLTDHVSALVRPPNFVLIVDGKTLLDFLLCPKGGSLPAHSVKVMDGAYKLDVRDVSWALKGESLGVGNPFVFHAVSPVNDEIKADGRIEVMECEIDPPPLPDFADLTATSAAVVMVPKIDLHATDLFGPVSEDVEHNDGAFIHFNKDNDNRNTTDPNDPHMGPPVSDYTETDFVEDEDDLCAVKITLFPLGLGKVTLKRDNPQLRVWCSPNKEASSAILLDESEKTWSLAKEEERKRFENIKGNLWVEGCGKGSSGLAAQYSYHAERYDSSDWVKFTFLSANCGRQPTPNEEDVLMGGMGLPLVGCEFSITGERDKKYNCIAWSVGEDTVIYKGTVATPSSGVIDIDLKFGDQDGTFNLEKDLDPFYMAKGFDLISESENQSAEKADVIYFTGDHAARKMNCLDGKGKWIIFESKLGTNLRIEHVWDQVISGAYGKPCRYYRKKRWPKK
jgi:hypothetical protein